MSLRQSPLTRRSAVSSSAGALWPLDVVVLLILHIKEVFKIIKKEINESRRKITAIL